VTATTEPTLAVDIGGTKIAVGLVDPAGRILARAATPADPRAGFAAAIQRVVALFAELCRQAGARPAGIGIGCTGPIDPLSGVLGNVDTLPGWQGSGLTAALSAATGLPCAVENDADAHALGEYALSAQRGADPFLYVTDGTGIGVGAVIAGKPLHGLLHPEVGHIHPRRHTGDAGFAGVCPHHGDCLEGLANGPALVARLGHDLGDAPDAHPVWDIEADYLGQLCAQLALTLSPRRIVLGGGVMQHHRLFAPIRGRTRHWLGGYLAREEVEDGIDHYVVPPALGDRSGILGALLLAMRAAEDPRPAT